MSVEFLTLPMHISLFMPMYAYVCLGMSKWVSFFLQVYLRHFSLVLMYNFPEQYSDALRLLCEGRTCFTLLIFIILICVLIFFLFSIFRACCNHCFVLWRHTQFHLTVFSSVFLFVCCTVSSVSVLTWWVAPPKRVYNWSRV